MEISSRLIDGNVDILLNGSISHYDEYVEIKHFIKSKISAVSNVTFYFIRSTSIDSYMLGYMLKLKEINKININIVVSNARLYNFLQYVDFNTFFDIKIKEYE